jgi:hypothetical protein
MGEKYVTVEGADEIIASFRGAGSLFHSETEKWFRSLSNYAIKQAQIHLLEKGAVDTNELIQGIHAEHSVTATSVESVIKPSAAADKYAAAVEFGSKPHWPPIEALRGWADRHDIPVWAVARSIAKKGTKPRHFWRDTWEDLGQQVDSEKDNFVENILRQL